MRVGVIGINYKSATLRLREKLAKVAEQLFEPSYATYCGFSFILLSTCNRTEIYFHSEELARTQLLLLNALRELIDEEFAHCLYFYFGADCFYHLAKVTAGVDSSLTGETEIQGQVKRAYEKMHATRTLAPELHFLFQKCLKIGKEVRFKYPNYGFPCLENTLFTLARKHLGNVIEKKILFVGLSEINYKIFTRFKKMGCKQLAFCNRTEEKARQIAEQEEVASLPWGELKSWTTFDMAIFGTKSPHFLVCKEELFGAINCRLVIDVSVPRNVDPAIEQEPFLTLLNVDQLNEAIDRKRQLKALEIASVETEVIAQLVQQQTAHFQHKETQRLQHLLYNLC